MAAITQTGARYVREKVPYTPNDRIPVSVFLEPSGNGAVDIFLAACQEGNIQQVILLEKNYAVRDKGGRTPLMFASMNKSEQVFLKVLAQTLQQDKKIVLATDRYEQNALHYACLSQELSRVKKLVELDLPVLASKSGEVPVDFTSSDEIHSAIGMRCQKARDEFFHRATTLLEQMPYRLTPEQRVKKLAEDHGIHVQCHNTSERPDISRIVLSVSLKKTIFDQLRKTPPKDVEEASVTIQSLVGVSWKPSEDDILKILKEGNIQFKKGTTSPLQDPVNINAILSHFREHYQKNQKPATLQEALDYVQKTYNVKCSEKNMTAFLQAMKYP